MTEIDILKKNLCQLMRDLYQDKILTDIGGNLSIRDPDEEVIWITPSGLQKNLVNPNDLIKIDYSGKVLFNESKREPSIETPMHVAIYKEEEDFKAIIHSHAPYATAYSLVKNPPKMPLLTAELSFLIPEVVVVPYKRSGSVELGEDVADALIDSGIVILENHGVVAAAESLETAAHKTRALEECLRLYVIANQFGKELRPFTEFGDFE
ncbi:MAG: class II aldolase/adducin family protein [Candidatus Thorarchaeota archaeon]